MSNARPRRHWIAADGLFHILLLILTVCSSSFRSITLSPPSTAPTTLLEDWRGLQADVLALPPGAKVPPNATLVLYDGGGGSRLRSRVKMTGYSGGMTADDG